MMASNEDVDKVGLNRAFGAKQIRHISLQVMLCYDRPVGQDIILQLCFLFYYLRQGGCF